MVGLEVLIRELRELVKTNKEHNCYEAAIFYANKIVHLLKDGNPEEYIQAIYELAQCYFLNKEYLRVVQLIDNHQFNFFNEKMRVLLGQAFVRGS